MTTDNIIDLLIIACGGPLVWALAATLALLDERKEMKKLQKSKDDLRESMSNTNYDLQNQLDRVKGENYALRTQLHQLRKERNTQSNG